jgi:hypothetical protein
MPTTMFRRPAARLVRNPIASYVASETLEDRIVLAAAVAAPAITDAINVDSVVREGDALVANATFFGQPTQIPLLLSSDTTDILNLEIGAIHLDLLGLVVDTSDICLDIVAESGPGNLLGNLLGGIAGLLDGGTPLGDVLDGLTTDQLNTLTTGLTNLLNGVFDAVLGGTQGGGGGAGGGAAAQQASTDILNLSLGPIELDLLGLVVSLDDCDGGPVTIDITAESGPGNLLGNLLGGIAGLLDRDPGNAIAAKLDKIEKVLAKAADDLLG